MKKIPGGYYFRHLEMSCSEEVTGRMKKVTKDTPRAVSFLFRTNPRVRINLLMIIYV